MSISSIETIYPYFVSEKKGEKKEVEKEGEKEGEKKEVEKEGEKKEVEKEGEKGGGDHFLKIKSNSNVNKICRQLMVNNDTNLFSKCDTNLFSKSDSNTFSKSDRNTFSKSDSNTFSKSEHFPDLKKNNKYDINYVDENKYNDYLSGHLTQIDVKQNSEIKIKDVKMNQTHEITPLDKVVESNCFEKKAEACEKSEKKAEACEKWEKKAEACGDDSKRVGNLCNVQSNIQNDDHKESIVTNNNNSLVYNEQDVNGEFGENYKSSLLMEDKKKVIINDIKNDNNIPENFNYLYDILEKKYKENINLDGSEYVYIYDICPKNDKYNSDKICYYVSNSDKSREVDSNNLEHYQNCNNKNTYLNFFNNFSNKFINIKKMFSANEMVNLTKFYFNDSESEICNLESVLNSQNKKAAFEMGDKINEIDVQTTTDSTRSESSNNTECNNVKRSKFIDKINYIFYTVIKKNDNEKSEQNEKSEKNEQNDDWSEKTMSNNILNICDYQKNKKIYELKKINMDKINSNMKLNINRRVSETDIYDIEIKKKGYTHIYIDKNDWKRYYCILFYLNNNLIHKDNLILKHYYKIYEGEYLYNNNNNINNSGLYTNCFLAFFNDHNFDFAKKNNIDLSIFIRKNMYDLIFEISNKHQTEIVNNGHFETSGKANKCIVIFDIYSIPYYLIPFDYISQNLLNNKNVDSLILDKKCENSFNFIYNGNILNSWIYYINMLTQKYIKINSINKNKNKPIKRIHDVNKKFNQWIEVFKQERNIKKCGQIY
ncbi:hypothetical protein [Plasmodium yoelii yoelii]|uniref:Uncharacterized protein n=3 Tax=Plasmodium yoelii TaxID=5861 RepID=A0AAE9WLH5_PLAYO|nr:hypothetical protein [Plasmodium yoelii yoelii]WBY54564.1 hypothetical protein Py17XNL_000104789 [Plasmodium yoelii yoelii]